MCDLKNTQILGEMDMDMIQSSSVRDETIWGRLYPIDSAFQRIDLKKDSIKFGRRADCDVNFENVKTAYCAASAYSNLHFTIRREFTGKSGHHALLEDSSSNGTFVNGEKVGKGKVQALKNNSEIALCMKGNKAFIYIDSTINEDKNFPPEIRDKYTISKVLGVGAYGEVRLAFEKSNCQKFAVKIIKKKKFTVNGKHQINTNKQIMSEIDILKKLDHPCIIRVHDVVDSPDSVFIVLDLVEGGELFDKIISIGRYDEETAKLLFYQMVLAIKYLHDKGISHRDLKPENLLLSSNKENDTLIKLTDFGLSKFFDSATMMKTFCGTPNYLAPEVLATKGEGNYTNKIDNWSLGVILYIILVGFPPFSDDELEKQIKEGKYDFYDESWSSVSEDAKDIIRKLMCVDPNKRASLEEVLSHDWIKNDVNMKNKADELMQKNKDDRENQKRCLDTSSSSELNDLVDKTTIDSGNKKRFKH